MKKKSYNLRLLESMPEITPIEEYRYPSELWIEPALDDALIHRAWKKRIPYICEKYILAKEIRAKVDEIILIGEHDLTNSYREMMVNLAKELREEI